MPDRLHRRLQAIGIELARFTGEDCYVSTHISNPKFIDLDAGLAACFPQRYRPARR
jgi:hypothetical protein